MEPDISSIYVTPYKIDIDDKCDDDGLEIQMWSHDRDSNPVLVRVKNFPASMFLELPVYVRGKKQEWRKAHADSIYEKLSAALERSKHAPYAFKLCKYKKLLYYQPSKTPMVAIFFTSEEALRHCKNYITKNPIFLDNLGPVVLKPLEYEISSIRKFFTSIDADLSEWLEVEGVIQTGESRLSKPGTPEAPIREIVVDAGKVSPVPAEICADWTIHPRVVAMDLEVYSHNHRAFPNEYHPEDCVFNASVIYERHGLPETRKKYCIVQKGCPPPKEGEVIPAVDEVDLFFKYAELINKLDPDIVTGFNTFGFDNKYFTTRLKTKGVDIPDMGRMYETPTVHKKINWKSSGYGVNNIHLISMPGRIEIDILPVVRRDYKLSKYTLDVVASHFLGKKKHDVSPKEMFQMWKKMLDTEEKLQEDPSNPLFLQEHEEARMQMKRTVEYCIQDGDLVIDLFNELNVWVSLKEMSSIMGVTITELFTRGQRVRVQSLVYHFAHKRGFVVDQFPTSNESYAGAYVFTPHPGVYDGIICLDFSSLYPSIIRFCNLCFSTLVHPDNVKELPSDNLFVVDFTQEIDTSKKKRKNPDEDSNEYFEEDDNDEDEKTKTKKKKYTVIVLKQMMKEKGLRIPSKAKRQDLIEALGIVEEEEVKAPPEVKNFYYEWIRKNVHYGILPEIEDHLVGSRTIVRDKLALLKSEVSAREKKANPTAEDLEFIKKGKLMCVILHQRQLALKTTANSVYGFLGNVLKPAASTVTFMGRQFIHMAENYCKKKYGADIIYGDTDSIMIKMPGVEKNDCAEWGERLSKEITELFQNPFVFNYCVEKNCVDVTRSEYVSIDKSAEMTELEKKFQELEINTTKIDGEHLELREKHLTESDAQEHISRYISIAKELFKNPMNMEYEKSMRMILFTKKRYAAFLITKSGNYKMTKSGEHEILSRGITLSRRDNCEWIRDVYLSILRKILEGKTVVEGYSEIVEAISNLMRLNFPIQKLAIVKTLGSDYKPNCTAPMKLFGEELARLGKPVQPGEKLDYIVVKDKENREKMGYKMRLFQDFTSGDVDEEIDKAYYVKLAMNSIDQLFGVGYADALNEIEKISYHSDIFEKECDMGYEKICRNGKKVGIRTPLKMVMSMLKDTEYQENFDQESYVESILREKLEVMKGA